ncbi:hypothetical protein [Adhaeribacter radiodurans]|uniref:Uncharacterized protein n=1 Tax=Adhaeribacter radiodurans TaxID=2745197 RepID=A0A7L7L520_9BACT|nr:hypothetical protein [Adhaeribacter radiodurans]QMU27873.1 hypothetical protein HUW48_07375 [Adhaeribacter radiodurans]
MKLQADGTKEWDKVISGNRVSSLQQTGDGGYLLGGSSNDDYWIVKLNAHGSKEWNKAFSGNSVDYLTSLQ